jgi:hypothetical protein
MPVHAMDINPSYPAGLYITEDDGVLLKAYDKHTNRFKNPRIQRNDLRKLSVVYEGTNINMQKHYNFWLLRGAEAERVLAL